MANGIGQVGSVDMQSDLQGSVARLVEGGGDWGVWVSHVRAPSLIQAGHSQTVVMPGASTLKIPLAVAAAKHLDWNQRVPVELLGRSKFPNVLSAFETSEALSVAQLVAFSLITSDNASATWLMREVGVDAIERTLAELGMVNTAIPVDFSDAYLNPSGRANVTTATDLASALTYISDESSRDERISLILKWMRNNLYNNRLGALFPDGTPFAHKTGTLEGVYNDAGLFWVDSEMWIAVVLADKQTDSFVASRAMAHFGLEVMAFATEYQAHK